MVNVGLLSGLGLLLYSLVMVIESLSYGYMKNGAPGAGFFPFWINLVLVVACVLYIIESIRKDVVRLKDVAPDNYALKKIGSLIGGLAFFCLTANFLGFLVAGIVLLILMFMWDFKPLQTVLLSVVFMGVVYVIFQFVLKVSLPVNALGF